jgi:hypothetical protein
MVFDYHEMCVVDAKLSLTNMIFESPYVNLMMSITFSTLENCSFLKTFHELLFARI